MKRKQFFWEQLQNTDELLNKDNLKEEKKKEKSPEEIIDEILKEEEEEKEKEEKEKEEKNSTSNDKTNKDDNKTDKNKLTETEKWVSKQEKKQKNENKQGQQKDENRQKSERENEEATFNQNTQKNVRANQENGKVSKEKIIKRKEGEKGEEEKLKGKDERKKDLEEDNDNLQNKNRSDVDYNSNVSKTFESNKEKDLKNAEKKEENFRDNVDNQKEIAEEKNQNKSESDKEEKKEKEKAKTKDESEEDLEVGKNKNVEENDKKNNEKNYEKNQKVSKQEEINNNRKINEEVKDEKGVNSEKGIDDEGEEYDENNEISDEKEINDEDEEYDENDEVDYIKDETVYSYKFNFQKAFEVKEDRDKKRERSYAELRRKFEQLLWLLGERESIYPCKGNDYFDVDLYLIERHNRFKNLHNFFYSHKKDKIVVIVDTSGSCYPFADLITRISQVALSFDLVEVYEAPNGVITNRLFLHKKQLKAKKISPPILNWSNFLGSNRKIIFVGDFDGGDSVVEASFTNKVIWFSVEDRYDDTLQHSWCSYSLKDFNGIYKKNLTIEDFIKNVEEIKREYAKYEIKFKLDNFYNQFKQVNYFHFKKKNRQF